jgi:hypothetical protein
MDRDQDRFGSVNKFLFPTGSGFETLAICRAQKIFSGLRGFCLSLGGQYGEAKKGTGL